MATLKYESLDMRKRFGKAEASEKNCDTNWMRHIIAKIG